MKIETPRKKTTVNFTGLKDGDCFGLPDNCIMMKVNQTQQVADAMRYPHSYNAVNIETGKHHYISDNTFVTKLTAKVVVDV